MINSREWENMAPCLATYQHQFPSSPAPRAVEVVLRHYIGPANDSALAHLVTLRQGFVDSAQRFTEPERARSGFYVHRHCCRGGGHDQTDLEGEKRV